VEEKNAPQKNQNHPIRNKSEPSAQRFWAESSDKGVSAQYLRPNLQPIYQYGFVVDYKVNSDEKERLNAFIRELFDYLLSIKATYYLCYGSYFSPTQLTTMYPNLRTLADLKAQYDPNRLFTSVWFENYREAF